jgi:DNA-binding NtrC family response regulator
MNIDKKISGKNILLVDDEEDVIQTLVEVLNVCKLDTATSYDEAKELLEREHYDVAILDIMGVMGFELLKIAEKKNLPTIMLTAHGFSKENLRRSAEIGAVYYVPKEEMGRIKVFIADVIEAKEKNSSPWDLCFQRLGDFYDKRFGGPEWRSKEREFWEKKLGRVL